MTFHKIGHKSVMKTWLQELCDDVGKDHKKWDKRLNCKFLLIYPRDNVFYNLPYSFDEIFNIISKRCMSLTLHPRYRLKIKQEGHPLHGKELVIKNKYKIIGWDDSVRGQNTMPITEKLSIKVEIK